MQSWLNSLIDDAAIKAMYGQRIPSLDGIEFHEIALNREGQKVLLRFDLSDFPETVPKKWISLGYNVVQLRLLAFGIRQFDISGPIPEGYVNLVISRTRRTVKLHVDASGFELRIASDYLMVESVSAYSMLEKQEVT